MSMRSLKGNCFCCVHVTHKVTHVGRGRQAIDYRRDLTVLPLTGFAGEHPSIEVRRSLARYAQRLPLMMFEVLCEKHNLSAMVGVMSNLAIDSLHDRMGLATNGYRPLQILVRQRFQRPEKTLPALFPESE